MDIHISKKIIKIIIIGDSGSGKTSLMHKYIDGNINISDGPTIGVDFMSQKMNYKDLIYTVNIWDTAGQERFQSLTSSYHRMSNCVMIVFDLTDRKSFDHVVDWINRSNSFDIQNEKPHILVGNKSDKITKDNIKITQVEIKDLTEKYNIKYIEASAYTGHNVTEAFNYLITNYIDNKSHRESLESNETLAISNTTYNNICCK